MLLTTITTAATTTNSFLNFLDNKLKEIFNAIHRDMFVCVDLLARVLVKICRFIVVQRESRVMSELARMNNGCRVEKHLVFESIVFSHLSLFHIELRMSSSHQLQV